MNSGIRLGVFVEKITIDLQFNAEVPLYFFLLFSYKIGLFLLRSHIKVAMNTISFCTLMGEKVL